MIELLKISLIAYVATQLMFPDMIFAWYGKLIAKLPCWVYYPLGGCFKCFVGQVCFWYFLITNFTNYNIIDHLFFVSAGIFLSILYDYLWNLLQNSE